MGLFRWIRTTVDGCLSNSRTLVAAVIITPTSQSSGTVTLYNGESTNDPQVILLQTGTTESKVINFDPPLYLDRGLYIDVGASVDDVLVQYDVDIQ